MATYMHASDYPVLKNISLVVRADWAAWLPVWHLPDGLVGPPARVRWDTTSSLEIGQTTYAVNRERVGREGREGSEGQSHKD